MNETETIADIVREHSNQPNQRRMTMKNNEWKKVCAACAEGTPPERCAYYGDPNGCNAPTLGAHPEGDLAERLQDELADAHDTIARLEAELAESRRERDTLAAEREMDEATRTHIPHETIDEVLGEMKRGLHYGRGYDIDDVNRFLRDWAVRIETANERSDQAKRCFTANEVYAILRDYHNEHYSVFPRDELTERLCHAFHDQFVADENKTRQ